MSRTPAEKKIIDRLRKSCDLLFGGRDKYFWLKIPDAIPSKKTRFIPEKPFDVLIMANRGVGFIFDEFGIKCPYLYAIEVKATYGKSIPKSRFPSNQIEGIEHFDSLGDNFHGYWLIAFNSSIYILPPLAMNLLQQIETKNKKSFIENEIRTASIHSLITLKRGEYIDIVNLKAFKKDKK